MTNLHPVLLAHAERLLGELLKTQLPADAVVSAYFRRQRELGHADRAFIAESVFTVLRHRRSLTARCAGDLSSRRLLLAALACRQGLNLRQLAPLVSASESRWLARAGEGAAHGRSAAGGAPRST